MGILDYCHSSSPTYEDSYHSNDQDHYLESTNNSTISSQPSLPSLPSLNLRQISTTTTTHHCISTLKCHSSIFSLILAGKHLYSGSSNSEIRLWNQTPSTHPSPHDNNIISTCHSAVKSLLVVDDNLFTAHQDHKIRVWKIDNDNMQRQTYKCISVLPTLNDRVARLLLPKNYVKVRRHKKCTWVHHVDAISALALSHDKSFIYSASWDRTFKVWRTSDFKCMESMWSAHDDAINAIVSSSDGFIYTGSADKRIKVWSKKEGDQKHSLVDVLEKHKSAVNALALSNDGLVLYSGACDRSIIVWESIGGGGGHMAVVGALRGHTKAILCLAVVGDLVCSGSADKTVRIWRRGGGVGYSCLVVLEGHRGPVKCLTAAGDNGNNSSQLDMAMGVPYVVYSGSLDCDVKIWQIWVPYL